MKGGEGVLSKRHTRQRNRQQSDPDERTEDGKREGDRRTEQKTTPKGPRGQESTEKEREVGFGTEKTRKEEVF